jgi:hypothetical protein
MAISDQTMTWIQRGLKPLVEGLCSHVHDPIGHFSSMKYSEQTFATE